MFWKDNLDNSFYIHKTTSFTSATALCNFCCVGGGGGGVGAKHISILSSENFIIEPSREIWVLITLWSTNGSLSEPLVLAYI